MGASPPPPAIDLRSGLAAHFLRTHFCVTFRCLIAIHLDGRLHSFHKAADMGQRRNNTDIERVRVEAVQRVHCGESPEKVIAEYGYARSCIYDWLKRHREGGDDALVSRRSPGRPPSFSNDDYAQLLQALLKPPPGLGAWAMTDLLRLIRKRLGAESSIVTAWRILRRMGIVPVGLRSRGLAAWRRAHPGTEYGQIFSLDELTTSAASAAGGAKDYWLLVAATPRNRVLFQLYAEMPDRQTYQKFMQKLIRPPQSTALVLSARSVRYPQAIELAIELLQEQNRNLPPEIKRGEQVVGEEHDWLGNRKRYGSPLAVYRLET